MVKRRGPPSQGWRAFLRNHAPEVAAMDLFVVPTIGFDLLYAFIIIRRDATVSTKPLLFKHLSQSKIAQGTLEVRSLE
jgi:hypothetical protein